MTRSRAMQKLAQLLDRLKGTDLPVLIWGETGAGKELVARIIHRESQRSGGPFLVVAPAAIPAGLLEAELFGAKAGAFTDLREDRRGILSLASGGTVLIDGIAEVGLDVQAKLLRVLSESTLRPLGSEREESFDVRFLFATACDLSEEVRQGRFRRDLLHRIDAVTVRVPPLRDRVEDFPELVKALLLEAGSEPPPLEPGVIDRLAQRSWPGNVRELKNVLSRLALESPRRIDVEALDRVLGEPDTTTSAVFPRPVLDSDRLPALQRSLARDYMLHHFRRLWGSTAALCRFLGFSRRQLYRKMKRLGISIAKERARLAGQRGE